jgi:hypothetical protein
MFFMHCGNRSFTTEQQYYEWMNNAENGLVKERIVNATHFKVNLVPSELLTLQTLNKLSNPSEVVVDSVRRDLAHAATFVLTIGPDKQKKEGRSDIVFSDVRSYEEYREKLMRLNFELEELITLQAGVEQFRPVLTNLENVYGLTDHRKINLVFVPRTTAQAEVLKQNDLELLFDDRIFNTGINRFVFRRSDIEDIPNINLPKI